MNRRNWKPTLLMMGLLAASPWSPVVGFCPFSSPIAQADPMQQPSGTLVLPDAAAAVGGFFWELGHGDPADGLGNDADSTLSGFPVGPDDAPWIRRDLVPAGLDWDWFFYGTDGCLSGGAGTGVIVAYVLDNATDGPNYALLAVAGTTAPVPGHYFDDINTAGGSSGHFVLLQPLLLIPRVTQVTLVGPGTLSVNVASAMASVNVHDDLAGSGPYPGLVDLSAVAALILYISIYFFMNLGTFAIIAFLRNARLGEEIRDYAGLVYSSPGLAICFVVILMSLVGMPPLGGFVGKFRIFFSLYNAGSAGSPWLLFMLAVGGINTVISLYYYLRLAKTMTMDEPPEDRLPVAVPITSPGGVFVVLMTLPVVGLGLWWDTIHTWVLAAASGLMG